MAAEKPFSHWNKRLHYFLGLYFLFFVWLFAFTGLLLNHGHDWKFAEFWPNRKISNSEQVIVVPPPVSPLETARDLMRQLDIAGEIQWLNTRPVADRLDFRVNRPGLNLEVKADFIMRRATVQRNQVNAWGVMHVLHTFTGVRINDANNQRDWVLTTIWALSMDAVAAGLIVIVLSGIVMWLGLAGKRLWGSLALATGVVTCGWFVLGLRWFFA
jgi:hypothetical protein